MHPRERQAEPMNRKRKRSTSQPINVSNGNGLVEQSPEGTQGIVLHELNADCLIKIFIKLDGCDLLHLLSIHPNFKDPARHAFTVLYKHRFYQFPSRHRSVNLELAKFVLSNVGDKIPCLELRPIAGYSAIEVFREVMKYSSQTAEKIKIFQSTHEDLTGKIPQFPKLDEISFKFGEISPQLMRFKWCPNLTRLYFYGITFPDSNFLEQIPHLEHISLKENRNLNAKNLMHFFHKNPQLRSLQFEYPGEFTREFFSEMNRNLPILEKLELDFDNFFKFERNVAYEPLYFQKLKSLSIHACKDHYTHILNNLAISNETLEVFELDGTILVWVDSNERVTNPLIEYRKLKKIRFHSNSMLDNLSMLDLPKLEVAYFKELEFGRSLEEMIDIVRKNKSLKFVQFDSVRKDHNIKLNLQFYEQFCNEFKKRDDLLIKMIERERQRFIEISNKTLCTGNLQNGSKRVKYNSDEFVG